MVKNNHQITELESCLLNQNFSDQEDTDLLEYYKQMASLYAKNENAIAVLSDLKADRSYIYNGALAVVLGLNQDNHQINTIWEEEVYNRIHPEDLTARHLQELHFFLLLKKVSLNERHNYRTYSVIRMKDNAGVYRSILHRTLYLCSDQNGSFWLALCLYNFHFIDEPVKSFTGGIQNCATGEFFKVNDRNVSILSQREIEVLCLVEKGLRSKEIADKLNVSKNTIDRHRQNIMEKLRVGSSIEAIRIAKELSLL